MSEEKTEKPTPKRRKEARKEGQVARTQEIGPWAALAVVGLALPSLVSREARSLADLMRASLQALQDPSVAVATELLVRGAGQAAIAILVLGSAVMLISVGGTLAQGGFYVASKSVKPSLKKLSLIQGAKRLFGPHALWEGAKTLLKTTAVGLLAWSTVRSVMPMLGGLAPMDVVIEAGGQRALGMLRNVAVAGLLLAVADYAFQRRRIGKQTRMSKDEVKQEHKQAEGDPMLKGAIRARQLAASRNRMMADVPQADVVLVNPTHVAVALRYEAERGAPVVVARGAGVVAARIRELAGEHDVPLVQDVPLARALYVSCEVGTEIPPQLFAAVAQILAFVIARRTQGARGGSHRSPRPLDELPDVPTRGRRRAIPAASPEPA